MSINPRENLLRLYRRQGYEQIPVWLHFCPALKEEFRRHHPDFAGDFLDFFGTPQRNLNDPGFSWNFEEIWRIPGRDEIEWHRYYPRGFRHEVKFDGWGIAHEHNPNSQHMTLMHHPLENAKSLADLETYPWPNFAALDFSYLPPQIEAIKRRDLAAFVCCECTIWEIAWYLRRMENLFMEMSEGNEMAKYLLDKITDLACLRVQKFADAGADIIGLGDDIGMQSAPMMSLSMYRTWLKPRLAKVIAAAKSAKPDVLIHYHSCGYVLPFIDDLIEAGVDILNPVQPESMDFAAIHAEWGDRLSFNGTIGTQKTMPFGTTEQVKAEVRCNLEIAGEKGGLLCCPTHMLEPEVPWENVMAYVDACRTFVRPVGTGAVRCKQQ